MDHRIYLPSPALAPYVQMYRVVQADAEFINHVLPGTSMVMAIRARGAVSYVGHEEKCLNPMVISGLRKSSRRIHYAKDTENILVVFKPAATLKGIPTHALFNQTIEVADLFADDVRKFEDEFFRVSDIPQRIRAIESFLLKRLSTDRQDTIIIAALQAIAQSQGTIRIKSLADALAVSQDVLEKRFRKTVGASPKQLAFLVRMQRVVTRKDFQSLTDLAYESGYFDQAHFNKDFRIFTGLSPSEFFRNAPKW